MKTDKKLRCKETVSVAECFEPSCNSATAVAVAAYAHMQSKGTKRYTVHDGKWISKLAAC
jgi:hypothetical protein